MHNVLNIATKSILINYVNYFIFLMKFKLIKITLFSVNLTHDS